MEGRVPPLSWNETKHVRWPGRLLDSRAKINSGAPPKLSALNSPPRQRVTVAPSFYQASMRTCWACKENGGSQRIRSFSGRWLPPPADSPLVPNSALASVTASKLFCPFCESCGLGEGGRSFAGVCRRRQHPMPQHRPSCVPQQHDVGDKELEARATVSARTVSCGNKPARAKLKVKLVMTSQRVFW